MLPFLTAAGMGLLKLGGTTAAVGGTGAAISQGALSIPGARNLLGMTAKDIAKGENYDLNDPSSYRDDIGDYLRSIFTGVSTDQVKEAAKQQAIKKVNQGQKDVYDRVRTGYEKLNLKAPDISEFQYQGTEGTAAAGFRANDRLRQLQALQAANAAGVDISGLGNSSVSEIQNAQRAFQKNEAETERLKIRNEAKADLLEQQLRQDKINEANRQREFKILQMQNALNNRRLDIQESRDYRKDRQMAIMQIMQGFANMGKAFAA